MFKVQGEGKSSPAVKMQASSMMWLPAPPLSASSCLGVFLRPVHFYSYHNYSKNRNYPYHRISVSLTLVGGKSTCEGCYRHPFAKWSNFGFNTVPHL